MTRMLTALILSQKTQQHCWILDLFFKRLSKVIARLRLLRQVIGLKIVRLFFDQWEAKPKPIAAFRRDFPRALGKFMSLLGFLIGSSCCLFELWLVRVIILVLVFRQSFENRSKRMKGLALKRLWSHVRRKVGIILTCTSSKRLLFVICYGGNLTPISSFETRFYRIIVLTLLSTRCRRYCELTLLH